MIVVGIDPGTVTGIGVWDTVKRALIDVDSGTILEAFRYMEFMKKQQLLKPFVIVEDARKRKWFGNMDREQKNYGAGVREGVGSVKRDCAIWEEFLTRLDVPFEMRYPSATKMKAEPFKALTGWPHKTNEHSRDAGIIVFGMNDAIARAKLIAFKDGADAARSRSDDRPSGTRPAV